MKLVAQAVCPRCGFAWNTTRKLVVDQQAFCPSGCGGVGVENVKKEYDRDTNMDVGGGKRQ